jgi:hypothetical protein
MCSFTSNIFISMVGFSYSISSHNLIIANFSLFITYEPYRPLLTETHFTFY